MMPNKKLKTVIPEAWFDYQLQENFESIKGLKELKDRFYKAELEAHELLKLLRSEEGNLEKVSMKGFLTMPPIDGATLLSLLALVDETDLERAKNLKNEEQSINAKVDRVKLSEEEESEITEHYNTWVNNPQNLEAHWIGVAERKFKLTRHVLKRTLIRRLPQNTKKFK